MCREVSCIVIEGLQLKNVSVRCKPSILGIDSKVDKLINFSHNFCNSTVYGVISNPGEGAGALSYTLAGKAKLSSGDIVAGDNEKWDMKRLRQHSCYVGDILYKRNKWGLKYYPTVEQLLEEDVVLPKPSINNLVEQLELSPTRMNRPLHLISNERWNATVAIGLAQGKSIFCFPFLNKDWKESLIVRLETCSSILKNHQCITIVPSDSEYILTNIVDEVVNLQQ
jgi:ABC-type glutathione transport system ATPase component